MAEEPPSSQPSSRSGEKSWLERLVQSFSSEPRSREELLEVMQDAVENNVLDSEALEMIKGTLEVADLQVREIMIARSQMVVINIEDSLPELLNKVTTSGHSRFPVVGETTDDVRGVLLAKDLLPLILNGSDNFDLESILRPANIIPESKRLNVLLKEFREHRYHMAMVIDEYGGISGLVTIEDILEEIVGEIEDETDDEDDESFIRKMAKGEYIIRALTPIEEFNEHFRAKLDDNEFDTIGGLLMRQFGHLPQRNESTDLDGFNFRVLYSDNRQIHLLRLTTPEP